MVWRWAQRWLPPLSHQTLPHWQLTVLVGLTIVRGLIYLALFPPWIAPDEPAHFEAIRIIGQEGQLPSYDYYASNPVNPELSRSFQTFRMWELLERPTPTRGLDDATLASTSFINYPYPGSLVFANNYPVLPHLILSIVSASISPLDIATELYILRLGSILLAVAITVIAWAITRRLFPDQPQFWLAIPAFIVFLPMHTHIFASVNTDVFAILLSSLLLLLLVIIFERGVSWQMCGLVLALLLLALFTKRTVVFTLLWVVVAGTVYLANRRRWSLKRVALVGLAMVGLAGAGLLLVIVRPQTLSGSLITMFNMNFAQTYPLALIGDGSLTLADIATIYIKSGLFAFITFWGDFGGANINIPWTWAYGLMLLCGLLGLGVVRYLFEIYRSGSKASSFQRGVFFIFLSGTVLSLLNAFFPVLVAGPRWGPPARYFFPAIIPIATFFYLGAWQLLPARWRQAYLLPGWLIGLVTYDTLVISLVLVPFLYG